MNTYEQTDLTPEMLENLQFLGLLDSSLLGLKKNNIKSKNKKDHHGAAKSGRKGEGLFRQLCEKNGIIALQTQKDFIEHYRRSGKTKKQAVSIWREKMRLACPYQPPCYYVPDFYLPETDETVEIKYGTAHGTTEEKIFLDLEKIRDGVYPDNLVYIFWGTPEQPTPSGRCYAEMFAAKVKKESLPCKVIFATKNNGIEMKQWIETITKG